MFTLRSFHQWCGRSLGMACRLICAASIAVSASLFASQAQVVAQDLTINSTATIASGRNDWNPADAAERNKPTLFLIGDSTVKNGTNGQVGWGTAIAPLFDPAKIKVQN